MRHMMTRPQVSPSRFSDFPRNERRKSLLESSHARRMGRAARAGCVKVHAGWTAARGGVALGRLSAAREHVGSGVCAPGSARWCLLADRSSHAAAFSVERAHRDTVAHPRSPPEASAQRHPWLAHLGLCCGACLHRAARAPRPGRAAWRSAAPALRGGVRAGTPDTHPHAWRMQGAAHETPNSRPPM